MKFRGLLLDPVLKWAFAIATVGAVGLTAIQMWRGDALVCANGAIFADTCEHRHAHSHLPNGAIIAFDLEECPRGWTQHDGAQGRFIVGTGRHTEHDEYGNKVDVKERGNIGGKSQVELEIDHLPSHKHAIPSRGYSGSQEQEWALQAVGLGEIGGKHGRWTAASDKKTRSHENMPPYIAFHLCKRSEA